MRQNTIQGNNSIACIFSDQLFIDFNLFQAGYEKCDSLHSFGPAARNHFLFHYIISGKGQLTSKNSTGKDVSYFLEAGQGFLISPNQFNMYIADQKDPWEYAWIEFDGLKSEEYLNSAGLTFDSPVYISNDQEMQQSLKDELLYMISHNDESTFHLTAHMYLFLDALKKSSSTRKPLSSGTLKKFYAREAISYIEKNYQNNISIKDIAQFCNLDPSYFGKIFKETVSSSPQNFLIRFRLKKACDLLSTTSLPLNDIGHKVGYPNPLHFSRAFKNVYGIPPREWRNLNKRFINPDC